MLILEELEKSYKMFRIEIYLNFLTFIKGIISNKKLRKINEFIQNKLTLQSKKKYLVLAFELASRACFKEA